MKYPRRYVQWNRNLDEPEVDQGVESGWYLSWNPDDGRFYVSADENGVAVATFKEWSNAVYYAKTHKRKVNK